MNNYKIIESRPELSSAQVLSGMNFAAVKAGALASTITIAGVVISKAIISKWFVAVAVLASTALVYKSYTAGNDTEDKNRPYVEEKVTAPLHYGSANQKVILNETSHVVSTTIKPIRITIPTLAPTEKTTEPTKEITSNAAVPSLISPTNIMSTLIMPTITLSNPGPAVCQPRPNNLNHIGPLSKPFKDSVK